MTDAQTSPDSDDSLCTQVRVFYEDTDASGVVYHANYLKYMERARTLWLEARGGSHRVLASEQGIAFTLADANIMFRSPARLDDTLDVSATVVERRRVRIVFAQEIHCEGRLLIKARFTVACVRLSDFKPRALPAVLLKEIE
ncbi:tol-pal system-associated acyl-CoA thioesterase [Salinisphaera aquimarina]|uniref:Tol-pal system-associated acyl-CoA thioesterase n=1 Tax=Salinisphaera aquimarina TaxID=2094031 RepID=A0ABV7EU53_9GAMM